MAHKKKSKKERSLRREQEIKKAHMVSYANETTKGTKNVATSSENNAPQNTLPTNDMYIKKDLMKTIILSIFAFAIIAGIWVYTAR